MATIPPNPYKRVTEKGGNTNIAMTDDEWREKNAPKPIAKPVQKPAAVAPTPAPVASPAPMAPPPIAAPMAGLTAAATPLTAAPEAAPSPAPIAPQGEMAPPVGITTSLPSVGTLRLGLGTRIYPSLTSPLAGLKRIY